MPIEIFDLSIHWVMYQPLTKRLSTAFAFMALTGIVAFGGGTRYFCNCTGTAILTLHEHCHGDDGEEGPAHHAPVGHRHDHEGDQKQEDNDDHHHELVESSTNLRLPDVVSSPELKLLHLLRSALSEWETARNPVSVVDRSLPMITEDPPSLSHQVARAVVRLI